MKSRNSNFDITIFIPCFNEEKYLFNTINKILKSNKHLKKKLEIIVIDDASSDNSWNICLLLKKKFNNLKIIKNNYNKGVSVNFRHALKISKGEFFRMVPGDDVDYIETHKKILKHIYDYDLIIPNYIKIKNKSKLRLFISAIFTFIINFLSGNKIGYYNGTCAFRTKYLKNIKKINNGFGFQAQIICFFISKGYKFIQFNSEALHREQSSAINTKNIFHCLFIFFKIFLIRLS